MHLYTTCGYFYTRWCTRDTTNLWGLLDFSTGVVFSLQCALLVYKHTHIHTYTHTHIHTYTHTHIHTYIHTHIHTYTRTHAHTHKLDLAFLGCHIARWQIYVIGGDRAAGGGDHNYIGHFVP